MFEHFLVILGYVSIVLPKPRWTKNVFVVNFVFLIKALSNRHQSKGFKERSLKIGRNFSFEMLEKAFGPLGILAALLFQIPHTSTLRDLKVLSFQFQISKTRIPRGPNFFSYISKLKFPPIFKLRSLKPFDWCLFDKALMRNTKFTTKNIFGPSRFWEYYRDIA
jgi:hypothetical protein